MFLPLVVLLIPYIYKIWDFKHHYKSSLIDIGLFKDHILGRLR